MLIHVFCSLGQNKQNEPDEKVVSHFSVHFWNDLFFLFHLPRPQGRGGTLLGSSREGGLLRVVQVVFFDHRFNVCTLLGHLSETGEHTQLTCFSV